MLHGPESTLGGQGAAQARLGVQARTSGDASTGAGISSHEQVHEAVARARACQQAWASQPLEQRAEQILALRDAIVDRAGELSELLAHEIGKPRQEGLIHEVLVTADLASFYAKRATSILAPRCIDLHLFKHRRAYVHYAPRGVVGVIAPWVFPLLIGMSESIMALLAGNAVVYKPSERTPLLGLKLQQIWDASGLPSALFQVVPGDAGTGAALVQARPNMISFAGSEQTGRRVAAACGELLIPARLQLGGKAAAVVCDDAELERTARALVYGAFASAGQSCLGVQRVYVHAGLHDALIGRIVALAAGLRQGDPTRELVDVGPMIAPSAIAKVRDIVDDALSRGASLRAGGRASSPTSWEPTILADCTHAMRVLREECLGPVMALVRVTSDDEAVVLANDSPWGLSAYVFSRDRGRGRRVAERLQVGTVMVNDVLAAYAAPELPAGGLKQSGLGSTHGEDGLRAMCEQRCVDYNRGPQLQRDLNWFPYRQRTYSTIERLMRVFFRRGSAVRNALDLL